MDKVTEAVDKILNLSFKNGNPILKNEKKRDLLKIFKEFDIKNDWIEAKDLTILEKVLIKYLPEVYKLRPISINDDREYYHNISYSIWSMRDLTPTRVLLLPLMYDQKEYHPKTLEIVKEVKNNIQELSPLYDKFQIMGKERITRNGKIPQKIQKKKDQEKIKGKLSKILSATLKTMKGKVQKLVLDKQLQRLGQKRIQAGLFFESHECEPLSSKKYRDGLEEYREVIRKEKGDWKLKAMSQLAILAKSYSEEESDKFYTKMAYKLGGIEDSAGKSIKEINSEVDPSYPFLSHIDIKFTNGNEFMVKNKIVINRSPLGTYFFQYPCTFHDLKIDGKFIKSNPSEVELKKALNNGK